MLTRCCICGCALQGEVFDEDSVCCPSCFQLNFAGVTCPELDPAPCLPALGLTTRQRRAYARMAARHREEDTP